MQILAKDSGLLQQGSLDGRGHVDRDESIGGEQIVLAAFIDDTKITVTLRVLVRDKRVNLVAFERRLVPFVAGRRQRTCALSRRSCA